jgi:pilus assembly protein CpaB
MKRLPLLIGVIALMLFVTTASAISRYMRSLEANQPAAIVKHAPVAPVVVAARDLPVGTRLEPHHLRTIDWPAESLPLHAAQRLEPLLGTFTVSSVLENEPVLPTKLTGADGPGLLPMKIPAGLRAIALRVNDVTGVAGFVAPGMKVDVIAVLDSADVAGGRGAFTLLENIEVLAIAQDMDTRGGPPTVVKTVTLLASPAQAERLALAGASASLQLALRGYGDRARGSATGVTLADISFGPPSDPGHSVELIRGKERASTRF